VDAVVLQEGTLRQQLSSPAPSEVWVRTFVLFLLLTYSLLIRREFKKSRRITESLREKETALSKTAKENELLLQEVHHRVKNNMQVISSICSLQSKQIEDVNALNVLKNSSNRIQAMARVHEHLYCNQNLSEIKTGEYFSSLVTYIIQVFEKTPKGLKFTSSIDDLPLGPDTLLTLGLILNELISNSLKHAFGDTHQPELSLKMFKDNEGKNHLVCRDNGIGMPDEISSSGTDRMGLFLLKSFVTGLDGSIDIDGVSGTSVHITF
jgi:two-component sensor histidine kinase